VSPALIEVDDHIWSNRGVVSGTVSSTYQDVDGFTFEIGDKTPMLSFSNDAMVRRRRREAEAD